MRVALLLLVLSFTLVPHARCQSVESNPQNKQQPAPSKPIKEAPKPHPDQGNAQSKQDIHRDYPVSVKEMPPKDRWDKTYIVLTGILVVIGAFTLVGILIQANETRKAAQAARDNIVLQHRPRVIIRGIAREQGRILVGETDVIRYVVANVGGTHATIIGSSVSRERFQKLPAIPPYGSDKNVLGTFGLKAGEYQERSVDLAEHSIGIRYDELLKDDSRYETAENFHLYFFGFIEYRDDLEILRRTGFCRRYDVESQRFLVVDDPEYEYAD